MTVNVSVPVGVYRHYKGTLYDCIGVGLEENTKEPVVIYVTHTGEKQIWARPLSEFLATVEFEGQLVPRFKQEPVRNNYSLLRVRV